MDDRQAWVEDGVRSKCICDVLLAFTLPRARYPGRHVTRADGIREVFPLTAAEAAETHSSNAYLFAQWYIHLDTVAGCRLPSIPVALGEQYSIIPVSDVIRLVMIVPQLGCVKDVVHAPAVRVLTTARGEAHAHAVVVVRVIGFANKSIIPVG